MKTYLEEKLFKGYKVVKSIAWKTIVSIVWFSPTWSEYKIDHNTVCHRPHSSVVRDFCAHLSQTF